MAVHVIARRMPPDLTVSEATLPAIRLPVADPDAPGARHLVALRRPTWTAGALLVRDRESRPVHLELSSDLTYWHANTDEGDSDGESVVRVSRVASDPRRPCRCTGVNED